MNQIETLVYQFSTLFMQPIMVLILLIVLYSLYSLGRFLMEFVQRRSSSFNSSLVRYAQKLRTSQASI
ncbi:hypothetical protein JCM19235_3516 [Vibrio maritimus]|uniref:Uncharacterized protein n=2 Tax=Vibrio maritimus TaxID=990268 RepID=A0A090TAF2_9VIBR|nr:hypothetical protein JCM19235_3516 [Vibrio maritimus]GAL35724.1 hypothetical protein JCM19240_571 [Vibrio maritimus]